MAAKLVFVYISTLFLYFVFLLFYARKNNISFYSLLFPFLLGSAGTLPFILIQSLHLQAVLLPYTLFSTVIFAFLEEGVKSSFFPCIRLTTYKNMVYIGGFIGIGFACVENIFYFSSSTAYLFDNFVLLYGLRLLVDSAGHFLFTSLSTQFILMKKPIIGVVLSSIAHSFFNYALTFQLFFLIIPLFYLIYFILHTQPSFIFHSSKNAYSPFIVKKELLREN